MATKNELFVNALKFRRAEKITLHDSFNQALDIIKVTGFEDPKSMKIFDITKETISWVEAHGAKKALEGREPAYHNRQHFADTCVALAFFLSDCKQFSTAEKLILLLTMLVHDFGHEGLDQRIENPMHEEKTILLLKRSPLQKLDFLDFKLVCKLIHGTSPNQLSIVNQQYLNNSADKACLMQCLINDADIATSFIDGLTHHLSVLILNELGNLNPTQSEIQISVNQFKSNFQLTTPIAKSYLDNPN